jgi:chromate transporter
MPERSQMTQAAAQEQNVERPISLAALFTAFLAVSLCGVGGGGGIVWARRIAVDNRRWISDVEFADIVSLCQFMPGPNMILMMSFVGWKVWGFPGAVASAFATSGPPCAIYFTGYRLWDRFRNAPWQRIVSLGLVPVTMGIVIASGIVIARATDTGWRTAVLTLVAVAITLATRLNPMWMILAGAALGGLGLL